MQIKMRYNRAIVSFEPKDWDNGTARAAIAYMKEKKAINKDLAYYIPTTKEWSCQLGLSAKLHDLSHYYTKEYDENCRKEQEEDEKVLDDMFGEQDD